MDVSKALNLAIEAHKDQTRKFTGAPYVTHPIEVALITAQVFAEKAGQPEAYEDLVSTALLHDVLEDCPNVTYEDIVRVTNEEVAKNVKLLTKPSKQWPALDRPLKLQIDLMHYKKLNGPLQNLKAIDRVCNLRDALKLHTIS